MEFKNNQRFGQTFPHQVPNYPYPTPNSNDLRMDDLSKDEEDTSKLNMAAINKIGGRNTFVETILRNSIGKKAIFYFSYPDSDKWHDVIYEGTVLLIGEDYLIIADETTKKIEVLLMLYLNWVEYDLDDGKGNWYENLQKTQ